MRRLFYRFSDEAIYYRYFHSIKTMPHSQMQEYVNVDFRRAMSIVGLIEKPGEGKIIAEGRYVRLADRPYGDIAFVVDEDWQGFGIASFMTKFLVQVAMERGLKGFSADVLASNRGMMRVFEKLGMPIHTRLEMGAYEVTIPFRTDGEIGAETGHGKSC